MTEQPYQRTEGPIHGWFDLDYTNYQVLHRTLMQSMPLAWQERMVACLQELHDAFEHVDQPRYFKVEAATEHEVSDLDEQQRAQLGITEDWYRGETPPEGLSAEDLREWEAAHEDSDGPVYHRDGSEIDGGARVLLPEVDPIPHYRHAYIEPQLAEEQPADEPAEVTPWCTFGEDDAPGAGCILPAGHEPANRHLVVPGDVDDE